MVEQRDGQRLRMIDVARKAGVSTATVGRVLHNRGYVSEETRQRVEKAIQDTDFQINLVAQSLRRQRTRTIGHILSNLLPNPFFAGVEVGVQEVAVQRGYNVMLWNAMGSEGRERDGVEAFIQRQVEAIVFTTPRTPANVELALKSGLEVVQVERPVGADSHMVLVDNYVGAGLPSTTCWHWGTAGLAISAGLWSVRLSWWTTNAIGATSMRWRRPVSTCRISG